MDTGIATIIGALIGGGGVLLGQRYAYIFQRRSRIHELQIEIFWKLYKSLLEVQIYAQSMTKGAYFEGEKKEEYSLRFNEAFNKAQEEFINDSLLLPYKIEVQVNAFFQKVLEGQVQLGLAKHPMVVDGQQRATFWKNAAEIANKEMPKLLDAIKLRARHIINSETEGIIGVLKAKVNL
jgi:hypothetical protein